MVLANLLTGRAPGFADVRCYWFPEAVERVIGWKPQGNAANGFIHLINSGSACLDATLASRDENGNPAEKRWWEMTEQDIDACLKATDWCPGKPDRIPRRRFFFPLQNPGGSAYDNGESEPGKRSRTDTADSRRQYPAYCRMKFIILLMSAPTRRGRPPILRRALLEVEPSEMSIQ